MHKFSDFICVALNCYSLMLAVMIVSLFFGCEKPNIDVDEITEFPIDSVADGTDFPIDGSSDDDKQELFLLKNDTASFFVARQESNPLLLSELKDNYIQIIEQMKPYRLPTRKESSLFRHFHLPQSWWSGTRCLCVNEYVEKYQFYTFTWGRGTVTVAGAQTKYVIKPIRTVLETSKQINFSIDINNKWKDNRSEQI